MLPQNTYRQMLDGSPVYKKMSPDMQSAILKAQGEDRDKYERIFRTEMQGIASAKTDLLQRNKIAVRDFTAATATVRRQKTQDVESSAKRSDEEAGRSLLRELDQA